MKQIYRLYGVPYRIKCTPLQITLSLSLFFLLLAGTGHAQVNAYARVTAINAARTQLTISNLDERYHTFAASQQVIVLQMQDNVIGSNTANNVNFGSLGAIAQAGIFETAVISSINGDRTTITLSRALTNTFNTGANSSVQVISFRTLSTGNYITTANIPAVAWDNTTRTGGVVAIQVGGTLTLAHNITADGQGFAGGAISDDHENACEPDVFRTSSADYGAKGNGIYRATSTTYARGRGRLLNGGGGGNDDNAGGAGGGNFSAGGAGGAGWTCNNDPAGGIGGISLNGYLTSGTRLFMGGGGGGGQGNNGTQTPGAAGGGIIIIKANAIITSCTTSPLRISANGNSSSSTTGQGNDGAGGAGAGGTILFQVNNFNVPSTCRLQITANGGNGGNVNNSGAHGGGGGGGQGAILFANAVSTGNVSAGTAPGTGGLNSNAPEASHAGNGTGNGNSGVIGGIGIILPVQLIYFSAEKSNQKAVLRWTASQEANTEFTVQHATDGVHFTTIGTVKATGNGNTATNYTFTHPNPAPGKNYYQLQVTGDPSMRTVYSSVVSVNMTETQSIPVAWPNPAHDHFSIRVNNEYSNKMHQLTITDLRGQVMYTNTYKPANGIITVTPAQPLKPGLYMFKVSSEGYEQSGKLMIR